MKKEAFGKVDGKEVYKYTLTGDNVSMDVLGLKMEMYTDMPAANLPPVSICSL